LSFDEWLMNTSWAIASPHPLGRTGIN